MGDDDITAAMGGRVEPAEKEIDIELQQAINEKPFWLKGIRCSCKSQRLRQLRGEFDDGCSPRKIQCKKCGLETSFSLSIDSILREFGRLTGQELWKRTKGE